MVREPSQSAVLTWDGFPPNLICSHRVLLSLGPSCSDVIRQHRMAMQLKTTLFLRTTEEKQTTPTASARNTQKKEPPPPRDGLSLRRLSLSTGSRQDTNAVCLQRRQERQDGVSPYPLSSCDSSLHNPTL